MNYFFIGDDNKYYRKGTLAHYLDKRVISRGEPKQIDLPTTLNPLRFLLDNIFKDRLGFVVINKKCCQNLIDTPALSDILKICTATGNLNIVYMSLEALNDSVDNSLASDSYMLVPSIKQVSDASGVKSESYSITKMRG